MNTDLYIEIIEDELCNSYHWNHNVDNIIFQQDSDPKRTSKKAKQCFKENKIQVMEGPAQSPHHSPIEGLVGCKHIFQVLVKHLKRYSQIKPTRHVSCDICATCSDRPWAAGGSGAVSAFTRDHIWPFTVFSMP
ncbi:hypothetical protein C2E23DRAFT_883118 [Lenzites betulinus]|nr:hypothetical protein C2E23DRAFT_883118 [Lenzites betulinus]